MRAFRPLVAETAAARIADRFVTAIALGQFVIGQKLPTVVELAELLEVSRTTVRDALGRLTALGYVEVSRGRGGGTVVVARSRPGSDTMVHRALNDGWQQLEVTLDFRSLVEQQIARAAADRAGDGDLRRLHVAVEQYASASADREASRVADLEVHQAIGAATGNARLADLGLRLRHEVAFGFEGEPYSAEVRAAAIVHHRDLVAAIADRDGDRAAHLAAEHVALTETAIRALRDRVLADTLEPAPESAPRSAPDS